ncbi:MAG TPA: GMC family oxidoreductase [Geminicoccaceae bacterium]|nr:GMC family oxidoreductase [Geminicoccaceae bacterium]
MLRDARELESGASVDCGLCIVGGGACGIAIARAFAGGRTRVCVLESGGLSPEKRTEDLNRGEDVGPFGYDPLHTARARYLGGTANLWPGRCRPLDPIDFRRRPWVPDSGWPFGAGELAPYYPRAHALCRLGPFRYDAGYWAEDGAPELPFDPDRLVSGVWQYTTPPMRFGLTYRGELERAPNVEVLLHANAVELVTDDGARAVTLVRAACLDGPSFAVRARAVVLACGALEVPRLLLASNRTAPRGLGNLHDVVGRYFMEHPHVYPGTAELVVADPKAPLALYQRANRRGSDVHGRIGPSERAQEEHGLLNLDLTLLPGGSAEPGYRAMRRLARWALVHGRMPEGWLGYCAEAVRDIGGVVGGALYYSGLWRRRARRYAILTSAEQQPNPDSRVTLSPTARDALGLPRLRLDWRLTALDRHSVVAGTRLLAAELERLGIATVRLADWAAADDDGAWPSKVDGGCHNLGTARMSDDPRRGVVDADCRVHGLGNLYVAGGAVFPTGGAANPTLTMLALALRLADHLRTALGERRPAAAEPEAAPSAPVAAAGP